MKELIEYKTIITATVISFFGFIFSKIISYFTKQITVLDSVAEIKKDIDNLEIKLENHIKDNKEEHKNFVQKK